MSDAPEAPRKKKKKRPVGAPGTARAAGNGTPAPVKKTQEQRDLEEREAIAVGLKKDGYNSSVVTRKMITQHGMKEAEAEALVGRIFGKKVSARSGDTTSAIAVGLFLVLLGVGGVVLWTDGVSILAGFAILRTIFWLGVIGTGVTKIIIALVNANVKDDLTQRRVDDD